MHECVSVSSASLRAAIRGHTQCGRACEWVNVKHFEELLDLNNDIQTGVHLNFYHKREKLKDTAIDI